MIENYKVPMQIFPMMLVSLQLETASCILDSQSSE